MELKCLKRARIMCKIMVSILLSLLFDYSISYVTSTPVNASILSNLLSILAVTSFLRSKMAVINARLLDYVLLSVTRRLILSPCLIIRSMSCVRLTQIYIFAFNIKFKVVCRKCDYVRYD
ncbi:hypothetical protein RND81_11G095700 [Saponaria officinalis]|uniref:Uncharacterized protein n=1 Tax=Saponaria officinalis TaxID=3572 RepID=A0AAW1HJ37_SAPOF